MGWDNAIYQIRLIKGKTTSHENEVVFNYLTNILKRTNKEDLLKLNVEEKDKFSWEEGEYLFTLITNKVN